MPPVRRSLAALSLVLLVPALGACGFDTQTDQVYQPGVGVNDRSGKVNVLGAVVVSLEDGRGTFVASLVNNDLKNADSLSGITGADASQQLTAGLAKEVSVPPDTLVNLANVGAATISGQKVVPGRFVRLTLSFRSGQETTVNVPVVSQSAQWADVTQAEPSASPSTTP